MDIYTEYGHSNFRVITSKKEESCIHCNKKITGKLIQETEVDEDDWGENNYLKYCLKCGRQTMIEALNEISKRLDKALKSFNAFEKKYKPYLALQEL